MRKMKRFKLMFISSAIITSLLLSGCAESEAYTAAEADFSADESLATHFEYLTMEAYQTTDEYFLAGEFILAERAALFEKLKAIVDFPSYEQEIELFGYPNEGYAGSNWSYTGQDITIEITAYTERAKEAALNKLEEAGLTGISDFAAEADKEKARSGRNRYVYDNPDLYVNVYYEKIDDVRDDSVLRLEILFRGFLSLPENHKELIDELWADGVYLADRAAGGQKPMLSFVSENFITYGERYFWEGDAKKEGTVSQYPFRLWLYGDEKIEKLRLVLLKPYYESVVQEDFSNISALLAKFCDEALAEELTEALASAIEQEDFPKELKDGGYTAQLSLRDAAVQHTQSDMAEVILTLDD